MPAPIEERRKAYLPLVTRRVVHKETGAVVHLYEAGGIPYAAAFTAGAVKPAWHFRFESDARRAARISKWFSERAAHKRRVAKRAADRKAKAAQMTMPEVGTVLSSVWGYEQTNVDFYRVEAVGGGFVTLIQLGKLDASDGSEPWMQGKALPSDTPKDGAKPIRRKWTGYGCRVDGFRWASIWKGAPVRWSSYA